MAAGVIIYNDNDMSEYLVLPFVPTETRSQRQTNWAEISPTGMSGGFTQFTQGGINRLRLELFLNDLGRRANDAIKGAYDDGGILVKVGNVQTALEWFEVMRNARRTVEGLFKPPAILRVHLANRYMGLFVIKSFSPRIVFRNPRINNPGSDKPPGEPSRAYVELELIEYQEIPTIGRNFGW